MSMDVIGDLAAQIALLDVPVIVNITGGEPTLHANLYDIVHMLEEHCSVIIFTNGSKKLKRCKCSYTISLHPQTNLSLAYKHACEVKDLVNRVYVMESLNDARVRLASDMFKEFPLRIEPLVHSHISLDPGPRDLLYNDHPISFRELVALKLNRFKGWMCRRSRIDVLVDGTVASRCFPCASIKDIDSWVVCNKDSCDYEDDIRGEKYLACTANPT